MKLWKIFLILIVGAIGIFLIIQLIPFGHNRTNPPTVAEPNWSSPEARALVKEHCFQCHSNETQWTWYSNIAPGSWLIAMDVIEGRGGMVHREEEHAQRRCSYDINVAERLPLVDVRNREVEGSVNIAVLHGQ